MTGLRVVVAAGAELRKAAIVRLLQDAGFHVAGEATDAGDLLRKVRAHRPDVLIAELPDPHRRLDECARAVRTIRGELPGVGVLVISRRVETGLAAALLESGAEGAGYLLEGRVTGVSRFIEAVRHVAARGSVLEPEVVSRLLARQRRDPLLDELSERDREVLAQMAAGVTNRGIARRMFLSERAIERHVTTIFDKLGITPAGQANRRVLAVLAYLARAAPA
jgi:DNA-binding NarL/FixJ family response regulator